MKHFLFILIIIATALIMSPSKASPGDSCSFSWQCLESLGEVCAIDQPNGTGHCVKISK